MTKNTKRAVAKRLAQGLKEFTIGKITYCADYDRKTVLFYLPHFTGGPQIVYFDEVTT